MYVFEYVSEGEGENVKTKVLNVNKNIKHADLLKTYQNTTLGDSSLF